MEIEDGVEGLQEIAKVLKENLEKLDKADKFTTQDLKMIIMDIGWSFYEFLSVLGIVMEDSDIDIKRTIHEYFS